MQNLAGLTGDCRIQLNGRPVLARLSRGIWAPVTAAQGRVVGFHTVSSEDITMSTSFCTAYSFTLMHLRLSTGV